MENTYNYFTYRSGLFRKGFAYLDLTDSPYAVRIFEDAEILSHIRFFKSFNKADSPYTLVMCSVKKKDISPMNACMDKLKKTMLLTGHNDYLQEWNEVLSVFYNIKGEK